MFLSPREYLQHIRDETAYLLASSRELDKEAFLRDETLKRAFVRGIEVIGEAVKHIPDTPGRDIQPSNGAPLRACVTT